MSSNSFPTKEQCLLLHAALGSGAPAVGAWGEWQASVDFDGYLDAESFALLPLLYVNLRRHGVMHPFMHKLKGIYRRRWCENQVQFQDIEEVVGRFHLSRIPTMLVNGAALSLVHYRDSALRTASDTQVLVPVGRAEGALALLREGGWTPLSRISAAQFRFRHPVKIRNGFDRRLEIRWDPSFENRKRESGSVFWRDAESSTLGGLPVHVLNETATLLEILLRGTSSHLERSIGWIADAITVLQSRRSIIDWAWLISQARKRRMVIRLMTAITVLHEQLNAPIPETVLTALRTIPISFLERAELNDTKVSKRRRERILLSMSLYLLEYLRSVRGGATLTALGDLPDYLQYKLNARNRKQLVVSLVAETFKRVKQLV